MEGSRRDGKTGRGLSLAALLAGFRRHYPGCEWRELPLGEFLMLIDEMSAFYEETD